jgi:hypothetical protein
MKKVPNSVFSASVAKKLGSSFAAPSYITTATLLVEAELHLYLVPTPLTGEGSASD